MGRRGDWGMAVGAAPLHRGDSEGRGIIWCGRTCTAARHLGTQRFGVHTGIFTMGNIMLHKNRRVETYGAAVNPLVKCHLNDRLISIW